MNKVASFFAAIGAWFKRVGIAIAKWFKNWFVKVDDKDIIPVRIGRWFKSLFVTVEPAVEPGLKTFWKKEGTQNCAASIMSIITGLLVGFVLLIIFSFTNSALSFKSAWEAFRIMLGAVFYEGRVDGSLSFGFNAKLFGNMLFNAMPLIMTGLSVAIAYKTGLFNIGAPGQYLMGTWATLVIALSIDSSAVSPVLIWILSFLGGVAAGFIWGCIPGLFKALLNVNEVITSIMCNWISIYSLYWFFEVDNKRGMEALFINMKESTKSGFVYKTSFNDVTTFNFGLDKIFPDSKISGGILIAILIAVAVFIVLNKTKFGYELKACGANRFGAKYAGMNDTKNIILSMGIAGGLAGAGAALYYLSGIPEYAWTNTASLPAVGFNGIAVGLLANSNPVGCVFTAMFLSYITIGGEQVQGATAYNSYISDLIVAIIVYLSAFMLLFKNILQGKLRKNKQQAVAATDNAPIPQQPVDQQSVPQGEEE